MSIKLGRNIAVVEGPVVNVLGTVHFLRGTAGLVRFLGGGSPQRNGLKGGPSKKIREKGAHVKYYLYWRGGRRKKFSYWGGHATF